LHFKVNNAASQITRGANYRGALVKVLQLLFTKVMLFDMCCVDPSAADTGKKSRSTKKMNICGPDTKYLLRLLEGTKFVNEFSLFIPVLCAPCSIINLKLDKMHIF
jgi:hypothetical protein